MVSERLNGMHALMHICQGIVPDIEKVIDLFSTKNRRRLTFLLSPRMLIKIDNKSVNVM